MNKKNILNKIENFQKKQIKSQNIKSIPKLNSTSTSNDNLSKSLRSQQDIKEFVRELKRLKK